MKTFIMQLSISALVIMAFSFNSHAEGDGSKTPAGIDVEQIKTNVTSHLDLRIKMLQDEKACIESVKTKEDLKGCRKTAKEQRAKIRKEMKSKKKGAGQQGRK